MSAPAGGTQTFWRRKLLEKTENVKIKIRQSKILSEDIVEDLSGNLFFSFFKKVKSREGS